MTNSDIQGALTAFTRVRADAIALHAQLQALGAEGISSAHEQALQALAVLAKKGEALLASGARKTRSDQIEALTNQIAGLKAASVFGGNIDEINARIAALTAQRATLLLEEVGDFSDIVSPAKVKDLLALAVRVHDAAHQKQKAAQIVGIVQQVATTAADVAAGIAVFV
jgi:hypothetical protein